MWQKNYWLCHHIHLIPKDGQLHESMSVANGSSLSMPAKDGESIAGEDSSVVVAVPYTVCSKP